MNISEKYMLVWSSIIMLTKNHADFTFKELFFLLYLNMYRFFDLTKISIKNILIII